MDDFYGNWATLRYMENEVAKEFTGTPINLISSLTNMSGEVDRVALNNTFHNQDKVIRKLEQQVTKLQERVVSLEKGMESTSEAIQIILDE